MWNNPTIWIVLIVGAVLVVGLALWLGRGLVIRRDKEGFSIETKERQSQPPGDPSIRVAKGLEVERATIGDIAGIKSEDAGAVSESKQDIDVLSDSKVKDAKVGDIVGIKREGKLSKDKT